MISMSRLEYGNSLLILQGAECISCCQSVLSGILRARQKGLLQASS